MPREAAAFDRSVQPVTKIRAKADPSKPSEVGAPIPGMITAIEIGKGGRVSKGDKLLTLEAMKMQTTLYAPAAGVIEDLLVAVGDAVDGGDLLIRLKA
jgi:pyruvate carboxylase